MSMSEEDLEVLEEKLKQWQPYKNIKWETAIESCIARENQAIENLIKSYKQEKESNKEYERILDIWDNRKYRKRYLEERRKEQPNLLYPDADEIYQKYYEEKEKNKKLDRENQALFEAYNFNDINLLSKVLKEYKKELKNSISKNKIREFIKEETKEGTYNLKSISAKRLKELLKEEN